MQARRWVYETYDVINGGDTQVSQQLIARFSNLKALHKPNKLAQPTLQLLTPRGG